MYGMPTCGSNSRYFVNKYTKHGAYRRGIWEMYIVFPVVSDRASPIPGTMATRAIPTLHWRRPSRSDHRTWDLPMGDLVFSFRETPWKRGGFSEVQQCRYELCALGQELGKCWSGIAGGPDVIEIFWWIEVTPGEVSQNGEDLLKSPFLSTAAVIKRHHNVLHNHLVLLFLSLLPLTDPTFTSLTWSTTFRTNFPAGKARQKNADSGWRRERELCSKRWNVDVLLCKNMYLYIGTSVNIESFKGLKQTPQTKEKQTVWKFGQMPKSVIRSLKKKHDKFMFFFIHVSLCPTATLVKPTKVGIEFVFYLLMGLAGYVSRHRGFAWLLIAKAGSSLFNMTKFKTLNTWESRWRLWIFHRFIKTSFLEHMLKPIGSMYSIFNYIYHKFMPHVSKCRYM